MKEKAIRYVIWTTFLSALVAFLSYTANSAMIINKLIDAKILNSNINVSGLQDWCLWLGIGINAVFIALDLIRTKLERDKLQEQRNLLIRMNKNILSTALSKSLKKQKLDFDVRLFIPKHPRLYKLAELLHFTKYQKRFVIVNLDLLAEEGLTKGLQFEVWPEPQGLVGMCYTNKAVMCDDNLEQTNNQNYRLDTNQVVRTSSLKWSICCPILNDRNDVVAIMALDGNQKISIDNSRKSELTQQIVAFSRLLFDSVPQLFKR